MLTLNNQKALSVEQTVAYVAYSSAACLSMFIATWIISSSVQPMRHTFRKFDFKGKCDWCSRVPSVVHSLVVLYFMFPETFGLTFDGFFQTSGDLSVLERNLCFSAGYFMYDFIIIIVSFMDLWPLYVFHHLAALWPLLSVLFNGCENYTFFASHFFYVEMTILPLQIVHWNETMKRGKFWVDLGYHLTFWLWIPFRIVLPPWLTYQCIFIMMPAIADESSPFRCSIAVGQGGVSIWLFCWLVFFLHILPAYYKRVVLGIKKNEDDMKLEEATKAGKKGDKLTPLKPVKGSSAMSPAGSPTVKTSKA